MVKDKTNSQTGKTVANNQVMEVLDAARDLAESNDLEGIVVIFAAAPEVAGTMVAHGTVPMTLASTCLEVANQLAHRPYMQPESSKAQKQEPAEPKPKIIMP